MGIARRGVRFGNVPLRSKDTRLVIRNSNNAQRATGAPQTLLEANMRRNQIYNTLLLHSPMSKSSA